MSRLLIAHRAGNDLDKLAEAFALGVDFKPLLRFPPVLQEIALLLDLTHTAEEVGILIEQHELVLRAQLFDVYEGDGVPADKKSLAFSVTYQSDKKTLTDKEVAKAQAGILKRLHAELDAELRG